VRSAGGRRFGDGEEGEVDVEGVENEMRDKRWERNPIPPQKGPLTRAEKRAERVKRDFPDPRAVKKQEEDGVVYKGWGAAFGEMEKAEGKIHGMAL
jgi:hypothetical protein